ncbi:hypothetical protein, partial [Streptomyces sp. NPDC006624]|uniref:hypothetical protein n=1 Tax=Streptomyces sp. NPDC006624 TaxID=3154892 RepID=UPI0033A78975
MSTVMDNAGKSRMLGANTWLIDQPKTQNKNTQNTPNPTKQPTNKKNTNTTTTHKQQNTQK